jgi:magnesium-transporting ATPase (P-type)
MWLEEAVVTMLAELYDSNHPDDCLNNDKNIFCQSEVLELFTTLALCHTVRVDKKSELSEAFNASSGKGKKHKLEYQSSSPDEKALVEACQRF